jgi:glucose/arabinose dehydrogenase
VSDLQAPAGVAVAADGAVYITTSAERGKAGKGAVAVIKEGNALAFASGLDDPSGIVAWQKWFFVVDGTKVWRLDAKGQAEVFVDGKAFPSAPKALMDIAVEGKDGDLYVSDAGDGKGKDGAIYRINQRKNVTLISGADRGKGVKSPTGLVLDGVSFLNVLDAGNGQLSQVRIADGTSKKIASAGAGSVAWDKFGRLFFTDRKAGKVFVMGRPEQKPVQLAGGFKDPAAICVDATGKNLLVVDGKAGTLSAVPARVPDMAVDDRPLALETAVAFPKLKWTGWKGESDSGKIVPLRPLVLTHAGDGSNRVFVATEHGVIHVFPNDQKADKTKVFLDIQDRVTYDDRQNEEGFLGLAFHPKYKTKGEFYVYYTPKTPKMTNVLSRFRVSKDDPDKADPKSEEILMKFKKPFWNHNGGTVAFGPDGFLYVAIGDGGLANDPFENGQKLNSHLGKILRIDVNKKDEGKAYAVPKDNPFVGKEGAAPEIWAYGLRNVWRMAFDRETGKLWAADVGQDLYEEINLIVKGGNYGWNLRESLHPFGAKGVGPRKDLIDPIWEYHHDVGKSVTGGHVYRGKRLEELKGSYLYGDYVTGKIWALRYSPKAKRVVANRPIKDKAHAIMSFGEDEKGEVYYMIETPTGAGIHWFVRPEKK